MKSLKKPGKIYLWAFIAMAIIFLSFHYTNDDVQIKRQLENSDYEVLDAFCINDATPTALVEMKSFGDRERQVHSALYWPTYYCPPLRRYSVSIIEPTKECIYAFNGDLIRLYYKDLGSSTTYLGLDDWQLTEGAKNNIENDVNFMFWKWAAKKSYDDYLKSPNGLSTLPFEYEEYLKNGLNSRVASSAVTYEIEHGC